MENGEIMCAPAGGPCKTKIRNVSGGVDFGLDRFGSRLNLGGAAARVGGPLAMGALAAKLGPRAAARVGPTAGRISLAFGGGAARSVTAPLSGISGPGGSLRAVSGPSSMFSGRAAMAPRLGGFAPRLSGFTPTARIGPPGTTGVSPQGVDLNLDDFSLSVPTKVAAQAVAGSWGVNAGELAAVSKGFWENISPGADSVFTGEDRALLRDIFNPHMSDRQQEGEAFVAPDTSAVHVAKLRNLVKEEVALRRRRAERFLSSEFVVGDAGPLFPSSWTSDYEIARSRAPWKALADPPAPGGLVPRPEYVAQARGFDDVDSETYSLLSKWGSIRTDTRLMSVLSSKRQSEWSPVWKAAASGAECVAQAHVFDDVMRSAAPAFDMRTEDGMRFRIYRLGSLEVRTTREPGGGKNHPGPRGSWVVTSVFV